MGKAIQRWVAEDGAEFDDERSMVLHELSILDAAEIEFFLKAVIEASPRKTIEYRKILKLWQAHLQAQQYPEKNDVPANTNSASNVADIDAKLDAEIKQILQPTAEPDKADVDWTDGVEVSTIRVDG